MSDVVTGNSVPSRTLMARVRRFRGVLLVAGPINALELSDSAEFIFRAIDGLRTVAELGELVVRHYDVSLAEAVADVAELVGSLAEAGVLDVDGAAPQ